MAHSCVENYIHLIFATKNRELLIPNEIENRLYSYITGIAKRNQSSIININGMPDHIHTLLKLHPSTALATMVKELKAYSSSWMKKTGVTNFSWQEGYGGFSYSKSLVPTVSNYIQNQKEHHKSQSFKDEIDGIKKNWGIDWDI